MPEYKKAEPAIKLTFLSYQSLKPEGHFRPQMG